MRLVYGIGMNDADYKVQPVVNGMRVRCPFYVTWYSMFARCYGKAGRPKQPTYEGCEVDERWHSFMVFKCWMEKQDWKGNQLDKDLILKGNKVYGPDTCLFVSKQVNTFMTERGNARGDYPLGVCLEPDTGKYKAQCHALGGGQVYLGLHDTPEQAHAVYKKYKAKLAIELASQQADSRVAEALIKRYVE